MLDYALFLLFVALAVYTQNLTGFALALVLLGLVGATNIFPLPDVVNVVSVIGLVNAALYLYKRRALKLERLLWPSLAASCVGTVVGVAMLTWMVGAAYDVLRLLLGLSIIGCAVMLLLQSKPRSTSSSPTSFMGFGLLSGLMGGLFSAAGPPLVYQVYRQPWTQQRARESLVFLFGAGSLLRLLIVVPTGAFTALSVSLSVIALPVVVLVTSLAVRRTPSISAHTLRRLVCGLLAVAGVATISAAMTSLTAS